MCIDCSAFISAVEGALLKMGKLETKVGRMTIDGMAGDLPKYGFTKVIGGEEPSALAKVRTIYKLETYTDCARITIHLYF